MKQLILACAIACALQGQDHPDVPTPPTSQKGTDTYFRDKSGQLWGSVNGGPYIRFDGIAEPAKKIKELSPVEIERLKRIDAELNVLDLQFQTAWKEARTPKMEEKNATLEPKCKAAGIDLADCVPDLKTGALTKRVPPPAAPTNAQSPRPADSPK